MDANFLKNMAIQTGTYSKLTLSTSISEENIRSKEFLVDITNPTSSEIDTKAVFVKGDRNTSLLIANVKINSLPFDLTGYTVSANVKENENSVETYICEVASSTEGIVNINIPSRHVDENGKVVFELAFQKDDKILFSQMYFYTVLGSLGEGSYGTENQMTALQQLIQQVQTEVVKVENLTTDMQLSQQDIDDIINMIGR